VLAYPDNTICKFKVEEGNAASVVGENFAVGFEAGSLAVDATCPLDVVKTRR
jgi:solute carrier family 25, member 39/40